MVCKKDADLIWQAYRKDRSNSELRNQLVEIYMPLVVSIAGSLKSRLPHHVRQEDLVSSGVLGLIHAVESFDPSKGIKFATYSNRRIRGAMLDDLRNSDWIPRQTRRLQRTVEAFEDEILKKTGKIPSIEEIAIGTSLSSNEAKSVFAARRATYQSLNKIVGVENPRLGQRAMSLSGILPSASSDSKPSHREDRNELIRELTCGLTLHERMVILLYYFDGLTMAEIGRSIGVSESRVSQLRAQALKRIRETKGDLERRKPK